MLSVRQHAGDQSIDISGTAPAGSNVDIVLYGTVSADIPVVRVNHFTVAAGPNGSFSTNVPIAADFVRGSIILVQASTPDGASASAKTTIQNVGSESIPSMDAIPSTPF